ncbi:MAG: aminotransferase class V [Pirellulaceae bacterium]|nr:MAG: aminotransferase class V [Pirellulaceae bacterium]
MDRRPDVDDDWRDVAAQWTLRPDVTYLNHGSFGPPPRPVQKAHHDWQKRLWEEPMDFYVRQLPQAWRQARRSVAEFLNTLDENLIFVENATAGMNLVAHSFPLEAGDEVLLTDHEYGAVRRIWEKRAVQCGATVSTVRLELPFTTAAAVVEQLSNAVTPRTRLAVVSHITSPTAVILPVGEIARALHRLGVTVVVDGPHALAQVPVDLEAIGCDFYTASCHKWLSAPFGSGLLYVAPAWHAHVRPLLWSWGVLPPDVPAQWWQEFVWMGTRDPSAFLAVPAAIEWMKQIGLEAFRTRTHYLAQQARKALVARFGREPLVPDDPSWYGSMAHIPLPTAAPPESSKTTMA